MFELHYNLINQEIKDRILDEHGVSLFVKRLDLLDKDISGNKWFKLKYNLIEAADKTILTFGGSFSNHIAATAAAGKKFGFKTIGIIRGEETLPLNPTLLFAKNCGMELHYVSRSLYANKEELSKYIAEKFNSINYFEIPEGGANALGVKGCTEILTKEDAYFDIIFLPCGTATTLAGIALSANKNQRVLGFSALKGGQFLENNAREFVGNTINNFSINSDFHFGGYAKVSPELITFATKFKQKHHIELDYVYTAKMFFGIFDLIKNKYFEKGTKLLAIHTGGLQGNEGFKEI